jgi:uncharacterized membrane protein
MNDIIQHLQSHTVGLIHVLFSVAALGFGTAITVSKKGTKKHLWLGRSYLIMMLGLNGSAFLTYELFGRFGPFHWLALASLATLCAGYVPAIFRWKNWLETHAYFMAGSFVGLIAAAIAEIAPRIPGWSFGPAVAISSIIVIVIGVWIMRKSIPRLIGKPSGSG